MNIFCFIAMFCLAFVKFASAENCNLTIGSSDYPPFTYSDAGNNVIGLDVELLNIISKQAGCNTAWKPINFWEKVVIELKSGEILMATSASLSTERQQYANFIAYRPDSTKIFVRKEDLSKFKDINSLEDLIQNTNFTVGIYKAYHYGSNFEKIYADPKNQTRFSAIPDIAMSDNFIKLKANQVDAVILETVVGLDLIKKNNWQDQIVALNFEMNDPGLGLQANLMISKAADPENKYFNILQNAVAIVQTTDAYKQIIKKYYALN